MTATTTPTTGLSYDDLVVLQDRPEFDGQRLELIDGELLVSPTPSLFHQRVSMNLTVALDQYARGQQAGAVFAAPTEVRLAPDVAVQPDLCFVRRERFHLLKSAGIAGAPDLVVEILSPSTRNVDQTKKKSLYERVGVAEYWVVDPDVQSVATYALVEGRYRQVPVESDIVRSSVIVGFAISLSELFEAFA
jgi:Uma2 family endonuclease